MQVRNEEPVEYYVCRVCSKKLYDEEAMDEHQKETKHSLYKEVRKNQYFHRGSDA